jgi:TonB family protein
MIFNNLQFNGFLTSKVSRQIRRRSDRDAMISKNASERSFLLVGLYPAVMIRLSPALQISAVIPDVKSKINSAVLCLVIVGALLYPGCAAPVVHTSTLPVARFQARPMFPFELRRAGVSGEVKVGFVLDSTGVPRDLYVVSSTNKGFEAAAVRAVSTWRFKPGTVDGVPVYVRMIAPITFDIAKDN